MFDSLRLEITGKIACLTLNRPETRNAFDEVMIAEIHQALNEAAANDSVRVLVLTGEGTAFSAGANIDWMRRMGEANFEANYQDALGLANMLDALANCPKPTIARVNGPAIGGGTGIVAACDIAIAADTAFFSFSEVKIGLVPACIAPHVIRKVGEGKARELFITGRRITAQEALTSGLLNFISTPEKLDQEVEELLKSIVGSGPAAVRSAKKLVSAISKMDRDEYIEYTARLIAELRTSQEGREGTKAFLEKRKPNWAF
jgi:methylglutaconyl-CoA hydratase